MYQKIYIRKFMMNFNEKKETLLRTLYTIFKEIKKNEVLTQVTNTPEILPQNSLKSTTLPDDEEYQQIYKTNQKYKNNLLESLSLNQIDDNIQEQEDSFQNFNIMKNYNRNCKVQRKQLKHSTFVSQTKYDSKLEIFFTAQQYFKPIIPEFNDIPTSIDILADLDDIHPDLIIKIQQASFKQYLQSVIKRRTRFFQEIPIIKIMQWNKKVDDTPLTTIPIDAEQQWKKCISKLYQFSGDILPSEQYSLGFDPAIIAKDLINTIFENTNLVDEFYLEAIKQVINNPTLSQIKYTLFIVIMASSITPSSKAIFPIMSFLYEAAQKKYFITNERVCELMKFALQRLVKTFAKQRLYPPSVSEISLTLAYRFPISFIYFYLRQILVPVYIYERNYDYIPIEPHFTERQIIDQIIKKHDLHHLRKYLGISLVKNENHSFVNEAALMVDIVQEMEDCLAASKSCYLCLRIKVFFTKEIDEKDMDSLLLIYSQIAENYLNNYFILEENQIFQLATLKLIQDYGNYFENNQQLIQYQKQNYFPGYYKPTESSYKEVQVNYMNKLISKREARISFLNILSKQELFQTFQFMTSYLESKQAIPKDIVLALRPYQFCICDSLTKKLQKKYHLIQVFVWDQKKEEILIQTEDNKNHLFRMKSIDEAQSFYQLMKTFMERAHIQQEKLNSP